MRARERPSFCCALALGLCVLSATGQTVAIQEHSRATSEAQVRSLIDAGRYDEAEAAAEGLVSATRTEAGQKSLEAATAADLLVEVLLRNGKGAQASTLELARQVVGIKETVRGPDAIELAPSLRSLGNVLVQSGKYQEAVPPLQRALRLLERTQGAHQLSVAESLDDLARALIEINRFEEAGQALNRALQIKETIAALNDDSVARTLEGLARLFHKQGNYADARPLLERAMPIRESSHSDNLDLAETFDLYGEQLWFEGNLSGARGMYARAVAVAETSGQRGVAWLPAYLRHLASTKAILGDLEGAVATGERALQVAEASLGSDHLEIVANLNDLAVRKKSLGDYAAARALYERALQIAIRRFGPYHDYVATLYLNLARLNGEIGDFAEARRQHDRAIAIWERLLGREHPFVATALDSLAEVLSDQGRDAEARPLYERALAIRMRTLKPEHHDLALTQMSLARTLFRVGSVSRAAELSARGLASLERQDTDDLELARALVMRADLERAWGDFTNARAHYERGLMIREQVLGESSPLVAEAHFGLAEALVGLDESGAAFEEALKAETIGRGHLSITLRYLPERQSLSYAAKRPRGLDLALSLSTSRPDDRVFDALIKGRALVLDEMAARRRVSLDASRPDLAPLRVALTSARQRLANLVVRGPSDSRPQQYVSLVEDARREKELAERALADKSAAFREEQARSEIGLEDVRAALPEGTAVIAFVRYDRRVIGGATTTPEPASSAKSRRAIRIVPSYLAFVMRAGQPNVTMVPLGSASTIDALVARWRDEATAILQASSAADAERTYRAAGAALRQRVWDPLAGHLKDVAMVFVVPDGTLNTVSLAALPVGQARYLIETGPVTHYLSAERDLVTSAPGSQSRGLLALGGPDFDDATVFAPAKAPTRSIASSSTRATSGIAVRGGCDTLTSMQFAPLAGTHDEVREVARLWEGSPASILENRDASERRFKREAPGYRVLHLATHGFFLGTGCAPGLEGTRAVGGLVQKRGPNAGLEENPLLLSGLALAGANRRAAAAADEDDGILTAEEVSALNLQGVEWAVLSACDTGLGEVKAGEGVFGLRRAFQTAGVHSVIMSLWSIDDQAARVWMRTLYQGRLQKHLSTADAMHQATLGVLRARRARGDSTHPFYWAAFVAAGDWR
jgi:CHAT domain-containing protein